MTTKPQINEDERLRALKELKIMDTPAEREFDDIALLAAQICGTPMAAVSLVDGKRLWFKSRVGFQLSEISRDLGFCSHVIESHKTTLLISDTSLDKRFCDDPLVLGEREIRFYAGTALIISDDQPIGTLCVLDDKPRNLTERQIGALQALGRQLSLRLELRRTTFLLQKANAELRNLSLTDDLTGLYNRRGFALHADQQLKLFRSRESEHDMWLMLSDMDGLKAINDTYGHQEGSEAIRKTAEILRQTFREADIIARPGGDEFLVLLLNSKGDVEENIIERLQTNLDFYNKESGKSYRLGMSIGLVKIGFSDKTTITQIVKAADEAMYRDKRWRREKISGSDLDTFVESFESMHISFS